jgi:hypothetical protein
LKNLKIRPLENQKPDGKLEMNHGGKRAGAGRPAGSATKRTRKIANKAAIEGGELPLEYALSVMRDPTASQLRRDQMAIAAMPFLHPRLSSVAIKDDKPAPRTVNNIQIIGVPPSGHVLDANGQLIRQIDGEVLRIESEINAH